jgi:hypothetical protein
MSSAGLTPINRTLNLIPRRAESRQAEELRDTFVDSGIAVALESVDHQVLFGRRGTGKTHALRYLDTIVNDKNDISIYIDLRNIGSPGGLFGGTPLSLSERAVRLLSDLLISLHDGLLKAVIEDNDLVADVRFVENLDELEESVTSLRVDGEVQVSVHSEKKTSTAGKLRSALSFSKQPKVDISAEASREKSTQDSETRTVQGNEHAAINFGRIASALRSVSDSLKARRIWLLLDEWSSVPPDIQPYLGEFIVRCILSLQGFSVKIAAIEQQSNFSAVENGRTIGIELGADMTANINLDEFMVFDQDEDKARDFLRHLLYRHLVNGFDETERVLGLNSESELVRMGFTERRAFDELVKAAEGVPRDALNIAAKAALKASSRRISVNDIRVAGRQWFQADKESNLRSRPQAQRLLYWIIDNVIKKKKARGFMVNQKSSGSDLLLALFDARVLHILRRGYSAQDEPGERYIVYSIDYGAYVDLMQTQYAPQGLFPIGDDDEYAEVPPHDLRSLRRTILDLGEFDVSMP